MEGFFGEFVKQWLCQRPGNLADYKEVRSVDGSKAPKKAAILQPADFYQELWAFCEWRENKCRGTGANSIEVDFMDGAGRYPFYCNSFNFDDELLNVTAVATKTFWFSLQRGIRFKYTYY